MPPSPLQHYHPDVYSINDSGWGWHFIVEHLWLMAMCSVNLHMLIGKVWGFNKLWMKVVEILGFS